MVQISTTGALIMLAVGYIGVNTIVNGVKKLFKGKNEGKKD